MANCAFGPAALVTPLSYAGSEPLPRLGRTESAEGVVSPVVGRREYLGKLELDKWTLPHAVEILATTVL